MTWSLFYTAFKRGILDRAAVAGRRNGSAVANRTASSNTPSTTTGTTTRSASTTTQQSKKKELKHNPNDTVEQWDFMVLDVSFLF